MIYPIVTARYAAVLALVFAVLSGWVIAGRFRFRVLHGDGGDDRMNRRIRAHGNCAEYVPFILLLALLLEAGGTERWMIHALLLPLVAFRVMHPVGMLAPVGSVQQYAFRGVSAAGTVAILVVAALLLLSRVV